MIRTRRSVRYNMIFALPAMWSVSSFWLACPRDQLNIICNVCHVIRVHLPPREQLPSAAGIRQSSTFDPDPLRLTPTLDPSVLYVTLLRRLWVGEYGHLKQWILIDWIIEAKKERSVHCPAAKIVRHLYLFIRANVNSPIPREADHNNLREAFIDLQNSVNRHGLSASIGGKQRELVKFVQEDSKIQADKHVKNK